MRYDILTEIADSVAASIARVKGIEQAHPTLSGGISGDLHSAVIALERAQGELDQQLGAAYRKERPLGEPSPET